MNIFEIIKKVYRKLFPEISIVEQARIAGVKMGGDCPKT